MFEKELSRLRAHIERCGRDDLTFCARATPDQIEAWERALGATLPQHYREFILQIGDGFHINRQNNDLSVAALDARNAIRQTKPCLIPFPFQKVIYDNYMCSCRAWDDLTGHEKMETDLALALGCRDWDNLALVLTGPKRGEVWQFSTFSWDPKSSGPNFIRALDVLLKEVAKKFKRDNPML